METTPWYMQGDAWTLVQDADDASRNRYFETILSQANGLLGIRAYDEEQSGGRDTVREGYLNGIFDEVDAEATRIINGDFPWPTVQMVSLPALFGCRIMLGGERFDLAQGTTLAFRRSLSMRDGVLVREVTWRSPGGRTTRLVFSRFLSAAVRSLGLQWIEVEALDWSGAADMDCGFAACPETLFRCGDTTQPELPQRHFKLQASGMLDGGVQWLRLGTRTTAHTVAVAVRLTGDGAVSERPVAHDRVVQTMRLSLAPGAPRYLERAFAVVTDRESDDPVGAARAALPDGPDGGDAALAASRSVWAQRWSDGDIRIDGQERDQKIVRYSLFQLFQMAIPPGAVLSIPARGLSFNRYRGLYFWDTEMFILPFFTWVAPTVAADLLRYRRATLPGAQDTARALLNRAGALFPWMSDSETGRDNSIDGRARYLVHQNADIAYAFDQYAQATGDTAFMCREGLPVLVETARFWMDFLEPGADGMLHSAWSVGPDEDNGGGRDNGFTHLMAQRNLELAADWCTRLADREANSYAVMAAELAMAPDEAVCWRRAAARIYIPTVCGTGIPRQDEYLLAKPPADMEGWNLRAGREDWRVPESFRFRDYRLIKQADIVLAMVLLDDRFDRDRLAAAYDFYEPMTQHISSLSTNTHAIAAARLGRMGEAYRYFERAAALDLDDLRGVTRDGLHAAALGGCWQVIVTGFAGLACEHGELTFEPRLPPAWRRLSFSLNVRDRRYRVTLERPDEDTGGHAVPEHEAGLARTDGDGAAVRVTLEDLDFGADGQAHADDPVLELAAAAQ